jgi:hypothetical protein
MTLGSLVELSEGLLRLKPNKIRSYTHTYIYIILLQYDEMYEHGFQDGLKSTKSWLQPTEGIFFWKFLPSFSPSGREEVAGEASAAGRG